MQETSVRQSCRNTKLFREWITSLGMTESDAASHLGMDRSMVNHIKTGRRFPSLAMAIRIEEKSTRWSKGPILCSGWKLRS